MPWACEGYSRRGLPSLVDASPHRIRPECNPAHLLSCGVLFRQDSGKCMGMGKSWARGNVLGSVTKITLPNTAKQISENFVVQSIMQTTVSTQFKQARAVTSLLWLTQHNQTIHRAYLDSSPRPSQASQPQMSLSNVESQGARDIERQRKRAGNIRSTTKRFRVLIIGRANAGKTTILQRVCNTTEQPKIFNRKGHEVSHVLDIIFYHYWCG